MSLSSNYSPKTPLWTPLFFPHTSIIHQCLLSLVSSVFYPFLSSVDSRLWSNPNDFLLSLFVFSQNVTFFVQRLRFSSVQTSPFVHYQPSRPRFVNLSSFFHAVLSSVNRLVSTPLFSFQTFYPYVEAALSSVQTSSAACARVHSFISESLSHDSLWTELPAHFDFREPVFVVLRMGTNTTPAVNGEGT